MKERDRLSSIEELDNQEKANFQDWVRLCTDDTLSWLMQQVSQEIALRREV